MGSIPQPSHNMLSLFFPNLPWDRFSLVRIVARRVVIGTTFLLAMVAATYWLEIQDDGYAVAVKKLHNRPSSFDISMFPMLVIMFLSPHLESCNRLMLHHGLFGRRHSARVLRGVCLRLGMLIAVPAFLAFATFDALLCVFLHEPWSWTRTLSSFGHFLLTLAVLPFAFAWIFDKSCSPQGPSPFAMIGKTVVTTIVLVFGPVLYDELLLEDFRQALTNSNSTYAISHIAAVAIALLACLLLSRVLLKRYLERYYQCKHLVSR